MYGQQIPPAPQSAGVAVAHDARAVRDAATLRFTELADAEKPRWAVLRISPAPLSGSATIPGAVIRGDTGQLVSPPGAVPATLKVGTWVRLSGVEQPLGKEGAYRWTEMLEEEKRSVSPEDFYSPFVKMGVIVAAPAPHGSGLAQFGAVHLIFDEWADRVDAAGRYALDHAALLEGNTVSPGQEVELRKLLSHENPLVRIEAFRQLVTHGEGAPELVQSSIASADHVAAVFTYLAIATGDDRLVDAVNRFVATAPGEAKLRPIAIGAHAASVFRGRDPRIGTQARAVLTNVANQLGTAARSNAYFAAMLPK